MKSRLITEFKLWAASNVLNKTWTSEMESYIMKKSPGSLIELENTIREFETHYTF